MAATEKDRTENVASFAELAGHWNVLDVYNDNKTGLSYSMFGNGKSTKPDGSIQYDNIVLTFKGTNSSNFTELMKDLPNNLAIAAGKVPEQATQLEHILTQIKKLSC